VIPIHHENNKYNLRYRITTVSTTRTIENDRSGTIMEELIGNQASRGLVKDDEVMIFSDLFINYDSTDVFIYIGGTGISRLDQTSMAIRKIAEREVPGFGQLFRQKSGGIFPYISDASLFIYRKKIIFTVPGSEDAQKTAFEIINGMANHLYHEINKE
jgi:molybdenum cofactor biosynthesis protein B